MKKQLLPWQISCLKQWEKNHYKGIVNVVTGAGKTILAIAAIEQLRKIRPLKIKIVVPKIFLMYQWHSVLRQELKISRESIGFFSGAYKSTAGKDIMIYVINSARDSLARHIIEDVNHNNSVLLIADECHHYGSKENARIFGYISHLPDSGSIFTLGLSATPWCKNYHEVLIPALGEEIYRFGFLDALKANIISKFSLFNISVSFNPMEKDTYDTISNQLFYTLHQLEKICPDMSKKISGDFFATLQDLTNHPNPEIAELARAVFFLSIQRKEVVNQAKYRIDAVVELVRRIPQTSKIIIFGERIETAVEIGRRLQNLYPNEVGVYHSKVPKSLNEHTLRQFKDADIRILVSCKNLDEGLDVSETDVGIVTSSTGSQRQRVQRLGRVLRKKQSHVYFYYIYVKDTTEEEELLKEILRPEFSGLINRIDLHYNEETGTFENPQYKMWEMAVVQDMIEKRHSEEEIMEFMRNADKSLLRVDWLLSEEECAQKLQTASDKATRNYYIAVLLIIRARRSLSRINFTS